MNDLLIPGLIVLALTTVVTAAGLYRTRRVRRALRRRQADSLRLIRLLKDLMGQIQIHRGLVSVLLNGDASKRADILAGQTAIAHSFRLLQRHGDPALLDPARMRRVSDYWHGIEEQFAILTPQDSFDRHSALIRQLLFLIGDTADHGRLQELPGMAQPLATLWSDLPAAAEAIGQARAVGAGVAAAGHCSSVARIRLRYLHQRVESTLARLTGLPGASSQRCPGKVGELLHELEQHLLLPSQPTITAAHYFRVASEALESVYAVFEETSDGLEKRLVSEAA